MHANNGASPGTNGCELLIRNCLHTKQTPSLAGSKLHTVSHLGAEGKENAIRSRFVSKIERSLRGLEKRIAEGKLIDRFNMERNLGRPQAGHPQVAELYEMKIEENKQGICLCGDRDRNNSNGALLSHRCRAGRCLDDGAEDKLLTLSTPIFACPHFFGTNAHTAGGPTQVPGELS